MVFKFLKRSGVYIGQHWLVLLSLFAALVCISQLEHIRPLYALRQVVFDYYQWLHPRPRQNVPVAVVTIDEKSLLHEGQWPWQRSRVATLINKIMAAKPIALGLDVVFPEKDRLSPQKLAELYPSIPPRVLKQLPDPDKTLAQSVGEGPVVMGVFAVSQLLGKRMNAPEIKNLILSQPEGFAANDLIGYYDSSLPNLPIIEAAASGSGLLNTISDPDVFSQEHGVVRRVPMLTNVAGSSVPTLSLEMLRVALDYAPIVVNSEMNPLFKGITRIGVANYGAFTDADGSVVLHFGKFREGYEDRYISASDILNDQFPVDQLNGRFVLIGFNALGLNDMVTTPLGEYVPGVDIHAQLLESLLDNHMLHRPFWFSWLECGLLLLLGVQLLWFIPRLSSSQIMLLGLTNIVVIIILSFLAFYLKFWLFDGVSVIIMALPIFLMLFRERLTVVELAREAAKQQLQSNREKNARISGELDAARRIQLGLLPNPDVIAQGDQRFELAVTLESAKEISGDYYDCFMLDQNHLYFAIGDVSGKGVPASLFMSMAKTLSATLINRTEHDTALCMCYVEQELNRNNPEALFVTSIIGILNLETGHLRLANAGHDDPMVWHADRQQPHDPSTAREPNNPSALSTATTTANTNATTTTTTNADSDSVSESARADMPSDRIESLVTDAFSGPPLCTLGDYPYSEGSFNLAKGDSIFLYTDGISEATRVDRIGAAPAEGQYVIFGKENIISCLTRHVNSQTAQASSQTAIQAITQTTTQTTESKQCVQMMLDEIHQFMQGQDAADDATVMCIRWLGPSA